MNFKERVYKILSHFRQKYLPMTYGMHLKNKILFVIIGVLTASMATILFLFFSFSRVQRFQDDQYLISKVLVHWNRTYSQIQMLQTIEHDHAAMIAKMRREQGDLNLILHDMFRSKRLQSMNSQSAVELQQMEQLWIKINEMVAKTNDTVEALIGYGIFDNDDFKDIEGRVSLLRIMDSEQKLDLLHGKALADMYTARSQMQNGQYLGKLFDDWLMNFTRIIEKEIGTRIRVTIVLSIFIVVLIISVSMLFAIPLNRAMREIEKLNEELKAAMEEMEAMNGQLIETRDALWGEMELAKKIQLVLLPKNPVIPGYSIAAYMAPATEVGGDYYDIINSAGYDWVVIGDVSGHGVSAGLVMMMAQTSISVVLDEHPDVHPSDLLVTINRTISRNIRYLGESKYMTMTVLAAHKDGRFMFSGLHQDIMIYRCDTGKVECVQTRGMWLGIVDDLAGQVQDDQFTLNSGDVILLYTDGITESWQKGSIKDIRDPEVEMYGDGRLKEVLKNSGKKATEEIKAAIIQSLVAYDCADDVTFVVMKRA